MTYMSTSMTVALLELQLVYKNIKGKTLGYVLGKSLS